MYHFKKHNDQFEKFIYTKNISSLEEKKNCHKKKLVNKIILSNGVEL